MLAASPISDPTQTLEQMRTNLDALAHMFPPQPGVTSSPAQTGGVRAEWIRPEGAQRDRVILFVHGGGYTVGSIDSHRDLAARVAKAANMAALAFDYRRAPEHPFPAALDDALHAFRWLVAEGHPSSSIALVGDSAGAGLAIATALALRDAGEGMPGALACMSPWVDLVCDTPSLVNSTDPLMQPGPVGFMAMGYLAGQDPRTPLISPLYADLKGLPRTLVQVGGAEGLRDDGERFAARAREQGVDVTLEVWDDMFHAWQLFAVMLDDGQRAIEKLGAFVRA
ncbi:alpha/beta hydrolase [Nannocystaceae bacterium ST9]